MRSKLLTALLALSILSFPQSPLLAQSPPAADLIQEDWQLVIGTPDIVGVGPQITTAMSPVSDDSTPFAALDLNYREYPQFQAGGMQIQVWSGDNVLSTATHGSDQFSTAGETITWTQQMSVDGSGRITYQVLNGQSTTFGNFGSGNSLTVTYPTSLSNLGGYSPATSAAKSGASWESNYVTQLTLVRVRYYSGGLLIATDSTPRSIIAPPTPN
jgi:hypothetical protein